MASSSSAVGSAAGFPLARVLVVSLGILVTSFDASLVNAVFPAILADLGQDLSLTSWLVTGNNLALASGMVLAGRGADAWGRGRVFVLGLLLLAVLSAACVAPFRELRVLIGLRIGAGLCGAMVVASSLALLSDLTDRSARPKALAIYAALTSLGTLFGPVVGAALLGLAGWRWGFAATAGLAAACWLLAFAGGAAALGAPHARRELPWLSGALVGLGLGLAIFTLSSLVDGSLPVRRGALLVLALALALAFAFRLELRSADPLVPRALHSLAFARPLTGVFALGLAFGAGLLGIPLVATQVMALSAPVAGLALAPAAVLSIAGALVGSRLAARFGYTLPSGCGIGLGALNLLLLGSLAPTSRLEALLLVSASAGFGIGLGLPSLSGSVLAAVGEQRAGVGSGLYNAARLLAIAVGVALFTALAAVSRPAADERAERQLAAHHASPEHPPLLAALRSARACASSDCVRRVAAALDPPAARDVEAAVRSASALEFRNAAAGVAAACALTGVLWTVLGASGRAVEVG